MAKALYRKYRPTKLSEVVGQEQVTATLEKSLEQGRISHAYLFIGARGTGKTSVARIFAHEINHFDYKIEDDYVDIIEIDGASNRGIDNIRDLREKATIAPTNGKYKVYIIDEVHALSKDAANALLKTLEEPPKHVVFIMATTDAQKIPITITSRAQTFTFKLADKETMFRHLKSVCQKEEIKIDDEALKIIVKRGGGSFRDSLSLLDQISTLSKDEITSEMVIKAMGLPKDEKIESLLEEYKNGELEEIAFELRELLLDGIKPEIIVDEIVASIIEKPEVELMSLLEKLSEIKAPFIEAKLLVALTSRAKEKNTKSDAERKTVNKDKVKATEEVTNKDDREKTTEEKSVKPDKEESKKEPQNNQIDFDWKNYIEKVKKENLATATKLVKCCYELVDNELNIYPDTNNTEKILKKEERKKILMEVGNGLKIVIREAGERPERALKDELLSKISDIMGDKVENDGGDNPF